MILRDGSIRCDIYEIFVGTVFAFCQLLAGLFQQDGWQQLKQEFIQLSHNGEPSRFY